MNDVLTRVGISLGKLVARLPHRAHISLGKLLGALCWVLLASRRRVAELNIKTCFPELEANAQQKLSKQTVNAAAIGVIESIKATWSPDSAIDSLAELEGEQHLTDALAQGNGVIILTAHFTTFELMCRLLNHKLQKPATMQARLHNNKLLGFEIDGARRRHAGQLIEKKDLKSVFEVLSNNQALIYTPDQNFTYRSVFAPFFNIPASTLTATAEIASESGAAIVPLSCVRQDDHHYKLALHPAWDDYPSGDPVADATRYNAWLEQCVRKRPEQYLWVHRRFKTLPEGYPPIYTGKALRKKHRK